MVARLLHNLAPADVQERYQSVWWLLQQQKQRLGALQERSVVQIPICMYVVCMHKGIKAQFKRWGFCAAVRVGIVCIGSKRSSGIKAHTPTRGGSAD